MICKSALLAKILSTRSNLFAPLALIAAPIFLIPACSDRGDPVGPGSGANQPPTLNAIGKQYVAINNPLNVTIRAADAESTPTFTIMSKPDSATFTDNLDGTATFSWKPAPSDAGIVNVTFAVTDDSSVTVTEVVTIEVITHTYDNYLGPIIRSACGTPSCHGAPTFFSGFDARTYTSLLKGGNFSFGRGIVKGDTARSVVYQRLLGVGGTPMPFVGIRFTTIPGRMDSIAIWILARAPEN
ncbi:MAG: hypothetical protein IH914_06095 [candidate division Zixibacteria bacterium]|nr:hypothetical protein [candidate division Zixibacteria bacterium]